MHGTAALDRINTAERRILFFLRTTTLSLACITWAKESFFNTAFFQVTHSLKQSILPSFVQTITTFVRSSRKLSTNFADTIA